MYLSFVSFIDAIQSIDASVSPGRNTASWSLKTGVQYQFLAVFGVLGCFGNACFVRAQRQYHCLFWFALASFWGFCVLFCNRECLDGWNGQSVARHTVFLVWRQWYLVCQTRRIVVDSR